jgi:hypothetical protein
LLTFYHRDGFLQREDGLDLFLNPVPFSLSMHRRSMYEV